MADVRSELEAAVRNALAPTWSETVRAKAMLRRLLSDGDPHGIRALQTCLLEADGVPPVFLRREKIQLSSPDDIETVVTPSHPAIAQHRLALAATEAVVVDLVALGTVIEVSKAPDPADAHPSVDEDDPFAVELRGGLLMDHTVRL